MSTESIILQTNLFDHVQRWAPITEVGKREAVLDSFEYREELDKRKRKARETSHDWSYGWLRYRIKHATTSDIVNDALGIAVNRFKKINNINGALFRGKEWVLLDDISSKRDGGHGNKIGIYVLREHESIARTDIEILQMTLGPNWKKIINKKPGENTNEEGKGNP